MSTLKQFRHSLVLKIILTQGVLLFLSLSAWMVITGVYPKAPITLALGALNFLITFALLIWVVLGHVKKPIQQLIDDIRRMKIGKYPDTPDIVQDDIVGQLAAGSWRLSNGRGAWREARGIEQAAG